MERNMMVKRGKGGNEIWEWKFLHEALDTSWAAVMPPLGKMEFKVMGLTIANNMGSKKEKLLKGGGSYED